MLFGMTYYQICWYFLIYSFGGWVVEVIFHAVSLGKVINRGFLNGPVCPIYGFGVLSVFAMINSFELHGMPMNDFWVFIFGVVLSTLVELIGGWLLDKCFHARWWDYTGRPFNFHGYICLKFSIIWGLAILFVVRIFQKYLENQPSFFKESTFGWIMVGILLFIYLVDFIVTVSIIQGFNKELKKLDDIRGEMRIVSDKLSEVVGVQTMKTATRVGEERVQINLAMADLRDTVELKKKETEEELYEKQKQLKRRFDEISTKLTAHSLCGSGRLLKAFPDMKHREHPEIVDLLKKNGKM